MDFINLIPLNRIGVKPMSERLYGFDSLGNPVVVPGQRPAVPCEPVMDGMTDAQWIAWESGEPLPKLVVEPKATAPAPAETLEQIRARAWAEQRMYRLIRKLSSAVGRQELERYFDDD